MTLYNKLNKPIFQLIGKFWLLFMEKNITFCHWEKGILGKKITASPLTPGHPFSSACSSSVYLPLPTASAGLSSESSSPCSPHPYGGSDWCKSGSEIVNQNCLKFFRCALCKSGSVTKFKVLQFFFRCAWWKFGSKMTYLVN